jgi:hypothetical protein
MAFKLPPPPAINQFNSASWQDWFFKLRTALIEAFSSITLQGIPAGGDAGDVLTKVDTVDYNATWSPVTISIPGGTADQLLTKIDATLNNYEWRTWTFHGIPAAGTTGQALVKTSNTDYAVNWATILGIPAGGSTNQVLGKTSGTDYAVSWQTVSIPDPPPTGNITHNSNFQHRDKSTSSVTFATAAPYSRHASRWYGIAPSSGFTTVTVTTDDLEKITVKRAAGTYTSTAVKLVQILDTEDSIKMRNMNKSLCFYWNEKSGANIDQITFRVSSGTGVNDTLANFLSGSWTSQTTEDYIDAYYYGGSPVQGGAFSFNSTISQIAFSIEISFNGSNSTADDEAYIYFFLVSDPGNSATRDDKAFGLISSECDRYYQVLKQYLTTTPIAVPIHMRKIPTITISPSVAFTTTGTTKDSLVINVNSSGDAGLYTVTLDCEF